ncbi:MAG: hypothetical protein K2Q01_06625, partial [Rickettsiales bacterium]|nr:hypothetical protein [Rickettsiales bacterium]
RVDSEGELTSATARRDGVGSLRIDGNGDLAARPEGKLDAVVRTVDTARRVIVDQEGIERFADENGMATLELTGDGARFAEDRMRTALLNSDVGKLLANFREAVQLTDSSREGTMLASVQQGTNQNTSLTTDTKAKDEGMSV